MQAAGILPVGDEALAKEYAELPDKLLASLQRNNPSAGAWDHLTIKQLILRALSEKFRDGATPLELRDFLRERFDRVVDRNSISPQLTRLREEGLIHQSEGDGRWRLTLNFKEIPTPN
jgi:hypothetical protein